MDRNEKVRLSLNFATAHAFRQGLFLRLYEASLCWFVHKARPLKIMPEVTKQGETLLYGGLPVSSFETLAAQNALPDLQTTEYGYTWDCPENTIEGIFSQWREKQLAAIAERPGKEASRPAGMADKQVIEHIRAFELARTTPMQAMNAIAKWQKALRGPGKEGA